MTYKVRFKYKHEANDKIIKPNFKKAGKQFLEESGFTVKGGNDFCYTVRDPVVAARMQVDKNRRKMEKLYLESQAVGLADKSLAQVGVKSPKQPKRPGG
jgi:hypothetical protein